mmetsp:Transcript_4248/g.11867  ORF Transcript_4248/g.11867 Transcript_4248/m.11867 type:complete len:213 (+) Transcript_4248:167-805(+)
MPVWPRSMIESPDSTNCPASFSDSTVNFCQLPRWSHLACTSLFCTVRRFPPPAHKYITSPDANGCKSSFSSTQASRSPIASNWATTRSTSSVNNLLVYALRVTISSFIKAPGVSGRRGVSGSSRGASRLWMVSCSQEPVWSQLACTKVPDTEMRFPVYARSMMASLTRTCAPSSRSTASTTKRSDSPMGAVCFERTCVPSMVRWNDVRACLK